MDEQQYQIDLLTAMNHKLTVRDSMYEMICSTSDNAFVFYHFENQHIEVLGNWDRFFDFTVEKYIDVLKILYCLDDSYHTDVKEVLLYEKTGKSQTSAEGFLTQKQLWVEFEITVRYDEENQPLEKVLRIRNITKFKSQYDELMYMAYYDTLTSLYNRNNFIRVLTEWIVKANNQDIISVMFVDIDNFHKVNDGMGMLVGDELVQLLGQFLREFESEHVIVSHFTSDLFCIAIFDPSDVSSVEYIYKAIQNKVRQPFVLADRTEITISVTCGVAEYPEAASTAVDLISYAEIVMFRSKSEGKGKIKYFDHEILTEFLENVTIEHKLREAVFELNFYLVFQPQYDTVSRVLRGVEALIRWRDAEGMLISPGVFIPIAEQNNLIVPIGDWVIEESFRQLSEWKERYRYPLVLSINISAIQYKKKNFVPKLLNALKKYNINYKDIELEITESILIEDFQDVIDKMHQLREYGIRVSVDDFGTGFSSLSYLKGLPIDTLKIDKTFIDTLIEDNSTRIIVNAIIAMAQQLGYETIAEGVETIEQYEYLKSMNCDYIQGYLLGKPVSAQELETILQRQL
ncbi:MAG: bifunctional diguanylate cyclase/phosphodiesterase [Lachnospiraceae bacterium]